MQSVDGLSSEVCSTTPPFILSIFTLSCESKSMAFFTFCFSGRVTNCGILSAIMCTYSLSPFRVVVPHSAVIISPAVVPYIVSPYFLSHSPIAFSLSSASSGISPFGCGPMFISKLAPFPGTFSRCFHQ